MDWTLPSSYTTDGSEFDRLAVDLAARQVHEAFVEVGTVLDFARDARHEDAVRDGIDRGIEAMTAYIAVDDELRRVRRCVAPLPLVETLKAICDAHRGTAGMEGGIRFDAPVARVLAVAEPAAAWIASVALGEMVRELSRRGSVRVEVQVRARDVTVLATAPASKSGRRTPRAVPTLPFLRRLVATLDGSIVRRQVGGRIMLCLTIPTAPTARKAVAR